ncbi:MAG TPA: FAD-dependent oxidoreductase [Acetobacteraceae bacterium]|jgi:glycine/D-amino acid oxidase-like deaminating enzyme|nr:FAD-dependent oxidoreductase [Acetobacteraceae bacterium]
MTLAQHGAIVIGAGVAGLSTALYLQRAGVQVAVIDPLPPAGGASFGNAGLLSPDTAVPIALPGMLRKVPGWLTDPLGPLSVRPSYFPRALPWLLRWIEAGRLSRVMAISDAMRALHRESLDCWKELLGAELYGGLIRPAGQVQVWEGDADTANAQVERQVRERHGIKAEPLTTDDLRQMFPGIAREVTRGLLVPGNGYTVSPQRSVRTLGELFRQEGGALINERAMKLIPRDGGGWMVMTNTANREAAHVVVAMGAWSRQLLDPLGVKVALETERGYHAMIFDPEVMPALPISNKTRAFGVTPMEDGLRVAGTVEIAGLDAPPNEQRARILVGHAKRMFPGLSGEKARYWMGFRPSTPDSLPILGPLTGRPGLHCVFGHGHFGMTGGPPSGRLVARLITGQAPGIDAAPYAAARFA